MLVLLTHPLNAAEFRDISGQDRQTSAPSASLSTPHHYASRTLTGRAISPSFLSGVGVFREPDHPPLPADGTPVSHAPVSRARLYPVFAVLTTVLGCHPFPWPRYACPAAGRSVRAG